MINNKRGWIKIVEAFIAVLLITGVLLVIINKGYIGKQDISSKVRETLTAILREIQLDKDARTEVLGIVIPDDENGVEINELNAPNTWSIITGRIPDYLQCRAMVCGLDVVCELPSYGDLLDKDIYTETVAITTDLTDYIPRQLKLFCWTK